MNFSELYKKIAHIEQGLDESTIIDECSCEEHPEQPKQQDSVNMNVTINGQGANGIRDLMDILRNIDDAESSDDMIVGEPADSIEEPIIDDSYENSIEDGSDATVFDMDSVTFTGDDLHSKGAEAPKQAGGGNPWNVKESLITNLHKLYEEVKQRSLTENKDLPGYGDEATWGWKNT